MNRMFFTEFAIFSYFKLLWMRSFVLGGVIISSATLFTSQMDNLSHFLPFDREGETSLKIIL